jgi:heme o synthase
MIKTLKSYLISAHIAPCLAVTATATLLAYRFGIRAELWLVASSVLSGQLAVGWNNDYIDCAEDAHTKRTNKPTFLGTVNPKTLLYLSYSFLILSLGLSFSYGTRAGYIHSVAIFSALAYNFKLKSTPYSVLTYFISFGLLPAFVLSPFISASLPPAWIMLGSGLLGVGVHFQNVLPDFAVDKKSGVKGFVHYFSYNTGVYLSTISLIVAQSIVAYTVGYSQLLQLLSFVVVISSILTLSLLKKNSPTSWKTGLILSFVVTLSMSASASFLSPLFNK